MYGTLAGWRTWATERGYTAPGEADDAVATAALVRASDYIAAQYVPYLISGYDETSQQVITGTYIAALYELETSGFFMSTYTEADRKVLTEVSGVKWTVVGKTNSVLSYSPTVNQIAALFDPITTDNSAPFFMFRSIGPEVI